MSSLSEKTLRRSWRRKFIILRCQKWQIENWHSADVVNSCNPFKYFIRTYTKQKTSLTAIWSGLFQTDLLSVSSVRSECLREGNRSSYWQISYLSPDRRTHTHPLSLTLTHTRAPHFCVRGNGAIKDSLLRLCMGLICSSVIKNKLHFSCINIQVPLHCVPLPCYGM